MPRQSSAPKWRSKTSLLHNRAPLSRAQDCCHATAQPIFIYTCYGLHIGKRFCDLSCCSAESTRRSLFAMPQQSEIIATLVPHEVVRTTVGPAHRQCGSTAFCPAGDAPPAPRALSLPNLRQPLRHKLSGNELAARHRPQAQRKATKTNASSAARRRRVFKSLLAVTSIALHWPPFDRRFKLQVQHCATAASVRVFMMRTAFQSKAKQNRQRRRKPCTRLTRHGANGRASHGTHLHFLMRSSCQIIQASS